MARRRRFSSEFKARLVLSVIGGEQSQAQLCRQHRISPQQLKRWRTEFEANAHRAFGTAEDEELKGRSAELERMVGRLTMQVDILKKASSILSSQPGAERR